MTVGSCLRWWRRLQMKPWRCSSPTTAVPVSVIAFAGSSTATWQCARGRGLPVAVSKPPPAAHCQKGQLASEALWWVDAEAFPVICQSALWGLQQHLAWFSGPIFLHASFGAMVLTCTALASWYVQQELVAAEVDKTLVRQRQLWDAHWTKPHLREPVHWAIQLTELSSILPSNSRNSSISTSWFGCNWQTNALDFLEWFQKADKCQPASPCWQPRRHSPERGQSLHMVGCDVKSSLTWPMALPDIGVKCVTCSIPGSATTVRCSSAAMSPPRPVLVWSCRPSKYSASSSPPLCCGSRVAAVFCLTRYRSLQTFFGSTNSCVLSCKTWDRCPIGNR